MLRRVDLDEPRRLLPTTALFRRDPTGRVTALRVIEETRARRRENNDEREQA
jgi:hypothetical protein